MMPFLSLLCSKKDKIKVNALRKCLNMNWKQLGESIDGDKTQCRFKQNVAISHNGNRVAIGSFDARWIVNPGLATVKVFDYDGRKWEEVGSFTGRSEDWFGYSIALSGDGKRLAIGVSFSSEGGDESGHVEVYENSFGNVWKALGRKLIGVQSGDIFGWLISLSKDGSRIAVGCTESVRLFEFDGDIKRRVVQAVVGEADWGSVIMEYLGEDWKQIGQTIGGNEEVYGLSLSADGNIVAIGTPFSYDNDSETEYTEETEEKGSVQVFRYSSNTQSTQTNQGDGRWVQVGQELFGKNGDQFGASLSINAKGNILAICATGTVDGNGHVKVFRLYNNQWQPLGSAIKYENDNGFGYSVCLSPNANRIAIGPYKKSGGYLNIFNYDGNDWVAEGNIEAPLSEYDYGSSVCLSSFGDRLAVGSIHFNGTNSKGRLRIYEFS